MMDHFAVLLGSAPALSVCHALHRAGWRPRLVLAKEGLSAVATEADGLRAVTVDSLNGPAASEVLAAAGVRGVLAIGLEEPLETAFAARFPLGVLTLDDAALPTLLGPDTVEWGLIEGRGDIGEVLCRTTAAGTSLVGEARCSLGARECAATLEAKLASAAAHLWLEHWDDVAQGRVDTRTFARPPQGPRRRPEDGAIRWHRHTSATLDRWVRAHAHDGGRAFFWLGRRRIRVGGAEPAGSGSGIGEPTLTTVGDDWIEVTFPDGCLRLSPLSLEQTGGLPGPVTAELRGQQGRALSTLFQPRRVLTVAAHPDDEILGAGGALIRHYKNGDEVMALIVCSAEPIRYADGTVDQGADSRRAAHYLGATVRGLGFPDQRLDRGSNLELIQAVEREIDSFRPSVIYTHFWGDVNADHARIAEAVDVAARPYSAPYVEAVYAFETPSSTEWTASARGRAFTPTVFVDISAELERKLDAMSCYRSELRPYPHPRSLRALRERAGYWGSVANLPAAEALTLMRSRQ